MVARERFDESHIRRVAMEVKALLETLGHPVRGVEIPTPGKHPHAGIMALLLLAMCAFGFAILLLSGVLIVNLQTALDGGRGAPDRNDESSWCDALAKRSRVSNSGRFCCLLRRPW